jgi:hypothetical protein
MKTMIRYFFCSIFLFVQAALFAQKPDKYTKVESVKVLVTKTGLDEKPFVCTMKELRDSSVCFDTSGVPFCLRSSEIKHIRVMVYMDNELSFVKGALGGFIFGILNAMAWGDPESLDTGDVVLTGIAFSVLFAIINSIKNSDYHLDFQIQGKQVHYNVMKKKLEPFIIQTVPEWKSYQK